MGKYGQTSLKAVGLLQTNIITNPLEAWHHASIEVFEEGTSSQVKVCPRNAFLGLCEAGLIRGIPQSRYDQSSSNKNKGYAIKAVELLRLNTGLAGDKNALWKAVMGGEVKKHNSQMDVVVALWENWLI